MRRPAAGWWFVAPALLVIVVFFVVPVVAALMLSFTDFDVYALGDARHVRVVALGNYARLLHEPRRDGARLAGRHERRGDHPGERQERHDRERRERGVHGDGREEPPHAVLRNRS